MAKQIRKQQYKKGTNFTTQTQVSRNKMKKSQEANFTHFGVADETLTLKIHGVAKKVVAKESHKQRKRIELLKWHQKKRQSGQSATEFDDRQ